MNKKMPYLTIKEIRQRLINGDNMPTAISTAKKTEHIVKPRGTIFGKPKKKKER